MSSSYVSKKLKVFSTKTFIDSLKQTFPRNIGYIFLSRFSDQPNANIVPDIVDGISDEKKVWDEMVIAKKVIPKDIEYVIPRYDWIALRKYKQYDDTVSLTDLLTDTQNGNEVMYPMYVINADGNVYKCLCNNLGQRSTVEPTGNFTENDGFIQTADGYLWKYMYNVKINNKFLTNEWIPVPYIQANTDYTLYNYSSSSIIPGSLNKIIVTDSGSNYYHTTLNVAPFLSGTNEIVITDIDLLTTSNNINVNMLVSGTGIFENKTYITEIDPTRPKTLILSEPTISSGGGNVASNLISILTRVDIIGDGTDAITSVELRSSNNTIEKIEVVNAGVDYVRANITIYGSGTNATARAVLPPIYGHGYNPAIEFGASNFMVISRIGEVDATENNLIPTDISFNQYGILLNPHKYNETVPVNENTSLDVISQTTDLTLLSFANYTLGEMVYQGSINNPIFSGYIVYQKDNVVKLNNVYKEPIVGSLLIGSQSGRKNPVVDIKNPDLEVYTGDILFARNILEVQRSIAQAEEVKLVFQF